MKKERHELSIEIKGRIYKGYRIIEWKDSGEIRQLIHYRMQQTRHDPRRYKPGNEKTMESVAKLILQQLIEESGDINFAKKKN